MDNSIQSKGEIRCDVCGDDTRVPGYGQQFGTLQALWGYGHSMMASATVCTSVSAVFSKHSLICGKSGESTGFLMKSNPSMS